jgi:hypothetical protein
MTVRTADKACYCCRYDGYEDAYNDASSSMTEEGSSSPIESSKGQRVRHRDVWKQQIKENSEKTNTQIKHGFKVSSQ